MNFDKGFSIMSALVGVALVTTIVARPNSANVIRAAGDAFSSALRSAQGR